MEPMTLGSPSGSPATNHSQYLPSYLLGEPQAPSTPRSNTLSPNKGGRNLSFATSPGASSPSDYNRSILGQKTLFGGSFQQTPTTTNYTGPSLPSHNASISGPPTQGLFDSLRKERNQVPAATSAGQSTSGTYSLNQSYQQQSQNMQQYNDSFAGNTSCGGNRSVFSPLIPGTPTNAPLVSMNTSQLMQCPPTPRYSDFWVTVFGFPASATSTILQHFSQCGTIVDKVFPSQNGNWVHLRYSSRLESDKALNYNEKILASNIMIGVTTCKDKRVTDKENQYENMINQPCKVRPLAQSPFNDSSVTASSNVPQKSTGLVNRAMDMFFGW